MSLGIEHQRIKDAIGGDTVVFDKVHLNIVFSRSCVNFWSKLISVFLKDILARLQKSFFPFKMEL